VPDPRKLSATVLIALACVPLTGVGVAGAHRDGRSGGTPVRTACTARASRRGAHAARRCHTHLAKQRVRRSTRLHATRRSQDSAANPVVPSGTSEATTQSPSTAHAATLAAVLATPCQNTELTPEAGNLSLVRAAVLCLINRKRAEDGETPLKTSAQLEEAAEGHCQELIADDYFAHVSPTGETPVDRIRETGYIPNSTVGYVIGENLAWGTYQLSTPQAIVAAWIASPGHLANILESQYTETGIGVVPEVPASLSAGSPGATYAQEFGVIIQ
jgi:uncharacterized protein YkwD